eukprot:Hpha_TRINITY_DN16052_c1_g6::TRINITY_DN16052_c1_g6_i1::g.119378::m.119378/K14399/CLP1, HERB; polyribonucleotide 5'-hydroxyl-kinase
MGSIADQEKLIEGIIWNEDYAVSKEVPWSQGSVSEKVMKMMFDDFCECLKLFDLPDLVPVRRAGLPEGPCIVVFGPPSERLSLLLAMNRLVPGCGHLVFSADWVSVDDRGHGNLKKGVTCDHLGKTTFVEYTSPPTITYLINMNTAPIVFGMGELSGPVSEYGRLADAMNCPRSSGDALEPLVADKLHTRLLAAGSGVLVPGGMAFVMDPAPYQGLPVPDGIEILSLQNITDADVATHLERLPYQRFVIKPSGPLWMQSMGVSFHDKTDLPAAVRQLMHIVRVFDISSVLVLGDDRLYAQVRREMDAATLPSVASTAGATGKRSATALPRSGGCVSRSAAQRRADRNRAINVYFRGWDHIKLHASNFCAKWSDVVIVKVGAALPTKMDGLLPLDGASAINPLEASPVRPSRELENAILGISQATTSEGAALAPVYGFARVTTVNVEREEINLLIPSPARHLLSSILVLGEIRYTGSS